MRLASNLKLTAAFCICSCVAFALSHGQEQTNQNVSPAGGGNEARTIFDSTCAKCHGKDGRAKTFAGRLKGARNFTDEKWQDRVTDEGMLESIRDGRGRMPAFGKKLSESQIESLAAFVRQFKGSQQSSGTH